MQINQSTGLAYKDQGIKVKGNNKQQIIKAAWASYWVELVKHYKPQHLVILGKGVHKAIGQDEFLKSIMQGMGGKYLGWNGHNGYNIMPLLCKLQQMALPPLVVAPAAAQVILPAATDVDKKDFYKNLNMDYLNMDEDDSISMSFSLDGFLEGAN